jgi:hypothetical protein
MSRSDGSVGLGLHQPRRLRVRAHWHSATPTHPSTTAPPSARAASRATPEAVAAAAAAADTDSTPASAASRKSKMRGADTLRGSPAAGPAQPALQPPRPRRPPPRPLRITRPPATASTGHGSDGTATASAPPRRAGSPLGAPPGGSSATTLPRPRPGTGAR